METILHATAIAATPLLICGLGGLIAWRAGVIVLALDGLMLSGAFITAWAGASSGDFAGVSAAVAAGAALGAALGFLMVVGRADQIVVGVAFNIFVLGLTSYALVLLTTNDSAALAVDGAAATAIPGLSDLPIGIGALFDLHWMAYFGYALVPILVYVLFRTGAGVRLRACGEYAEGARVVGVRVARVRVIATALSGALAAAAGAFMVVGDVGAFNKDLSGGRGYIALVLVILGRWNPVGVLLGALLFGLAQALVFYLPVHGVELPSVVVSGMPYIAALVAIVLSSRQTVRGPAEEGRPLAAAQ